MGFSLAWLGVRGVDRDAALERLLLAPTGRSAWLGEKSLSSLSLANGTLLIVSDAFNHRIMQPESFARLSEAGVVIACFVEEHVMFSASELWAEGRRI